MAARMLWAKLKELLKIHSKKHGEPKFHLHQVVVKTGGRYQGPGIIVGWTAPLDEDGYRLYNVAMQVSGGSGLFVHVFPASALRGIVTEDIPVPTEDVIDEEIDQWIKTKF